LVWLSSLIGISPQDNERYDIQDIIEEINLWNEEDFEVDDTG
jgi:hypothetical protein